MVAGRKRATDEPEVRKARPRKRGEDELPVEPEDDPSSEIADRAAGDLTSVGEADPSGAADGLFRRAGSAAAILAAVAASVALASTGPAGGRSSTPVQRGRMWKCRWNTTCPPALSLNCRIVNPSAASAVLAATATFWTEGMKRPSCSGGNVQSIARGALGITRTWPNPRGMMSMNARLTSSSQTFTQGASPRRIFAKMLFELQAGDMGDYLFLSGEGAILREFDAVGSRNRRGILRADRRARGLSGKAR